MKSPWQQFIHNPDGSIRLEGHLGLTIEAIEEQGRATARNIEAELGLPKYFEEWEILAKPRGCTNKHIKFILLDESPTRFPGKYGFQPKRITLPSTFHLEFGHRGFVVGVVHAFMLGFDELRLQIPAMFGVEIPNDLEGDYIVGQATLFDSGLAEKAWEALQRGIFTHVCPLVFRKPDEPVGTGQLVEVSLVDGDYPGCRNAWILKTWEA